MQYSYVRTLSVLDKAGGVPNEEFSDTITLSPEELDLVRYLMQYEYYLEVAASEYSPNILCNYLFELAQKFNVFYQKNSILNPESEDAISVRSFRLTLTKAVGNVLNHGLATLGIDTVSKM